MKFELTKFSDNRSLEEAREIYEQRITDALEIYAKYRSSFIQRDCPFCASTKYYDVEKFHNTYGVSKCKRCNSLFVNPAPSLESLKDYYNNSKCNILLDNLYRKRKSKKNNFIIDDRVEKVIEYLKEKDSNEEINILEIGCSSGSFLVKLKQCIDEKFNFNNIKYHGIDIDKNAVEKGQTPGINLMHSPVEEFVKDNSAQYDFVLNFELIEHLIDPFDFMKNIHKLLKENGKVIFTTQNLNGLEMVASHYNSYRLIAHSIFPPMHLNAFSTSNITHFAIRSGFNIVDVSTPGKLDVDMISSISEYMDEECFKSLKELDDNTKGLIQYLVKRLNVSSHMQCILEK